MKFKRKLQRHGGSHSANLPEEWIKSQGLKAGDKIEMEDDNGDLIIRKVK